MLRSRLMLLLITGLVFQSFLVFLVLNVHTCLVVAWPSEISFAYLQPCLNTAKRKRLSGEVEHHASQHIAYMFCIWQSTFSVTPLEGRTALSLLNAGQNMSGPNFAAERIFSGLWNSPNFRGVSCFQVQQVVLVRFFFQTKTPISLCSLGPCTGGRMMS